MYNLTKGSEMKDELNRMRIMQIMAQIEARTGEMFQDTYPELEVKIWDHIDNKKNLSFLINQLSKILDEKAV